MSDDGCYFSVYLVPIEVAIEDDLIRSIVLTSLIEPNFRLHCLLCETPRVFPLTPYIVVGYNEAPGHTSFMSAVCEKCSDGRSVDQLRPQVFDRIRQDIMPDAKLVGIHPGGRA